MKKLSFFIFFFLCFISRGWAQQSLEDSLTKIVAQGKEDEETIKAYNDLGYEFSRKNVSKAKTYLAAAILLSKKINYQRGMSNAYSMLVYLNFDNGRPDSADYYLSQVKRLADGADASLKEKLSTNYYVTAALYYKKKGEYQKAIPFLEKGIALFQKSGNKESTAGQTLNLGNTYQEIGNYQKATEQHLKALRLFEEIKLDRGISFCYQSLSSSFTKLKDFSKALSYANKSLTIKRTLHDERGIGSAESGLGDIYAGQENFTAAISHYTTSLTIAKQQKNLTDEQEIYFSLAKMYVAKNDPSLAIDYFTRSKKLATQLKDSSSLASIENELVALQSGSVKDAAAENKLKSSIDLFEERGDLNRKAEGFKKLADFYTTTKQFEKALEYNNKYYQTLDTLRNTETQIQVKKMEENYTVEKKEKEITILKKDQLLNQASLQRQKTIQLSLALLIPLLILVGFLSFNRFKLRNRMQELELRNQIAADLHDEVGSSLSSINMLSEMAALQNKDNASKELLARMSMNAKETMDKMGDIVWMIKPGETETSSLKNKMESFAYEICSTRNIATSIQIDDLDKTKLTMDQRKNIYLIFKEVMNNAVKYSGTEKINVNAVIENKILQLIMQDEGNGFDIALAKKGNGLDNIKHRAEEMGGTMNIESGEGTGTIAKLIVPVRG